MYLVDCLDYCYSGGIKQTHDELHVVLQVLARGGELLRGGVLKVPQLVLHAVVELLRVLLPLQVELAADGGVLQRERKPSEPEMSYMTIPISALEKVL